MENASAIFYYENSAKGKREDEPMMAHEIAHQWFGDMVTESNFDHLWLSEGFATYLKHIYLEATYGNKRFVTELKKDRDKVISFNQQTSLPVVDSVSPLLDRLNANSYQKGGWVLHMLRVRLGDSVFHQIIRNYYKSYAGKNATTKDFQRVCETISGKNVESFFQQWLYRPGMPQVELGWRYDTGNKKLVVIVEQLQDTAYQFPLDIEIKGGSSGILKQLDIRKKKESFEITFGEMPTEIRLDPKTSLLFEGRVARLK
jgi:aminopeptidase N